MEVKSGPEGEWTWRKDRRESGWRMTSCSRWPAAWKSRHKHRRHGALLLRRQSFLCLPDWRSTAYSGIIICANDHMHVIKKRGKWWWLKNGRKRLGENDSQSLCYGWGLKIPESVCCAKWDNHLRYDSRLRWDFEKRSGWRIKRIMRGRGGWI